MHSSLAYLSNLTAHICWLFSKVVSLLPNSKLRVFTSYNRFHAPVQDNNFTNKSNGNPLTKDLHSLLTSNYKFPYHQQQKQHICIYYYQQTIYMYLHVVYLNASKPQKLTLSIWANGSHSSPEKHFLTLNTLKQSHNIIQTDWLKSHKVSLNLISWFCCVLNSIN